MRRNAWRSPHGSVTRGCVRANDTGNFHLLYLLVAFHVCRFVPGVLHLRAVLGLVRGESDWVGSVSARAFSLYQMWGRRPLLLQTALTPLWLTEPGGHGRGRIWCWAPPARPTCVCTDPSSPYFSRHQNGFSQAELQLGQSRPPTAILSHFGCLSLPLDHGRQDPQCLARGSA